MRQFTTLVAAIGAVFAMTSAQAVVLLVDDFNAPDRYMHDNTSGAVVTMNDGPTVATQLPTPGNVYTDATRAIVHNWTIDGTGGCCANLLGSRSSVTIGNQASPTGSLSMANAPAHNSEVDITWSLAADFVPLIGPVSFFFDVVSSDSVPVNISYSLNGSPFSLITTFNAVVPPTVGLAVPLSAAEQALLNPGGTLTLRFTGDDGWDFAIDSFGFRTPEPASLALVGLALLGAGVASRRRKG